MKQTLYIENTGKIIISDKDYLASGGEAAIYVKNRTALKIFHDKAKMPHLEKIKLLKGVTPKNILAPKNIIRNKDNEKIGFTLKYVKNTYPLCKFFTKSFKDQNKISNDDIVQLISKMQKTISLIHKNNFLIVDLNELNILVSSDFKTPYFIDTDSWQCDRFHATAIMESIRDPLVKNNKWTKMSDWFSFAIIICQLYLNIHPYKGSHPSYSKKDWRKRMDEGASVFDKGVTLPRVCNDLSVIPPKHLDWFKSIFVNNDRSIPPFVDAIATVVSVQDFITESTEDFETALIRSYGENIVSAFNFMGVNYVITTGNIYKEDKVLPNSIGGFKASFCESSDMSPVVCKLKDDLLVFEEVNKNEVGCINALNMMYRNGAIYSVYGGHLTENTFERFGDKLVHKRREAANVLDLPTRVFDGVIFQDLLGKPHITLPYEKGKCITLPVKELNGYRLLDAKSENNICAIMAEKRSVYYRFVMVFNSDFSGYTIHRTDDVTYAPVNFTVMSSGVCIMQVDSDVQIFKGNQVKVVNNPPFDSGTKLFNASGGVYFIDKNKIYSVKMKK